MGAAGLAIPYSEIAEGLSPWVPFSPLMYSVTNGSRVSIARTITRAVWIKRAGWVTAQVDVTANATSTSGASVALPIAGIARQVVIGSAAIMGGTPPAQSGVGYMSPALDSVIVVTTGNGFCDITSGQTFRYSVSYQCAYP